MSGLESYDNGRKRNWRGWQWNRIVERLMVPVEEALVLYLCGPDDFDREKALARGFSPWNLIAVDLEGKHVCAVRKNGGIAISHDLPELIHEWPRDWRIDAVVADLCSGLDDTSGRLTHAVLFSLATREGSVISVNLQRGRDAFTTEWRQLEMADLDNGQTGAVFNPGKHRGFGFLLALFGYMNLISGQVVFTRDAAIALATGKKGIFYPAYNSYTSSGRVYMDTAVFSYAGLVGKAESWAGPFESARRKIAACRAVRTQKMKKAGT